MERSTSSGENTELKINIDLSMPCERNISEYGFVDLLAAACPWQSAAVLPVGGRSDSEIATLLYALSTLPAKPEIVLSGSTPGALGRELQSAFQDIRGAGVRIRVI